MYTIYADGNVIYKQNSDLDVLKLINPKLTLTENSAGSLEMTIPRTNIGYSSIFRMKTEIVVKKDGVEIWSGRVLNETINFLNNRVLYCEGELAYLNDSIQPSSEYTDITVYDYLSALFQNHNEKVGSDKYFQVGIVTSVEDTYLINYVTTNYETTMEKINELLGYIGGIIRIRKENGIRYFDFLADYPNTSSQTIEFGKNLLDISTSIDMLDFTTAVCPLGCYVENEDGTSTQSTRLTISNVNDGNIYVESADAITEYGWIAKTIEFDDVTDASELKELGEKYLSITQFENLTLDITAIDLHLANKQIESINILDKVHVISKPHGMDTHLSVTKLVIPMDDPKNTSFTLGNNIQNSLTSINNKTNEELLDKIENLPTKKEILDQAQDNASMIIQTALNGYITIINGPNGSQELVISSEKDYLASERVWRWNVNGLGYSSTGYNGNYKLALTMDGSIVADMITSGTINANLIRAGIIKSIYGDSYWNLDTGEFTAGVGGKVIVGNYAFVPRTNGNTSIKYIG